MRCCNVVSVSSLFFTEVDKIFSVKNQMLNGEEL